MTAPDKPSEVEQAKAAAERVEDWAGADHFDDCPSRDHEAHDCQCPDTIEGEEACSDLVESECECYLGAMRDCQTSIHALLASRERLRLENERLRTALGSAHDEMVEAEKLNNDSVPLARRISSAIEWCKYLKEPEWSERVARAIRQEKP